VDSYFDTDTVRGAYGSSYHIAVIDRRRPAERPVQQALSKQYGAWGTPHFVFMNGQGEMLCKTNGFSNTWDAMNLHRYVQALAKDPKLKDQAPTGGCGRIEGT